MDVRLVVDQGKGKTREIPLPGTVFLIGRGQKCHLRPHCRMVSKLHCAIATWAGKVAVRDLNSANGTYINKKQVRGEARVFDGDVLQVGSLSFTFRIAESSSDSLPVPIVRETDLSWLMEAPADSSVLGPDSTQRLRMPVDLFPETFGEPEPCTAVAGQDSGKRGKSPVSAGEYLRDYFRQRKPGRVVPSPKKDANS